MKIKLIVFAALLASMLSACGSKPADENSAIAKMSPTTASPTPAPTTFTPKNGDYDGKGVVTKLNLQQGSIEMNHEEIKDVMPAMQMEFFVSDKKILDGVKVGDRIDFVLRYKDHTETIVGIKKAQ